MNLLIPYVHLYNHPDPLFNEFTYGDKGRGAKKLKNNLEEGDYVFFHTSINGKKFITAYYVMNRVLDTAEVVADKNIVAKYKNPHILEFISGERTGEDDDVILFGDPITSKILERPLLFDKTLAEKLSLNIKFPEKKTETQIIGSATRSWRTLSDKDVEAMLNAIKLSKGKGISIKTMLSTDEVTELIEKDIETLVQENSSLIGESLTLKGRQFDTSVGRIDLLFEDKEGNPVIVELKLNKIGREAIKQLKRYMDWAKKETKKDVTGIIVCKGVMPAFEKEFKKINNIKILFYGWQLKVYPWSDTS